MKTIPLCILFSFFTNQLYFWGIPKCYLNYQGTTFYKLKNSFRQDESFSHVVELPISLRTIARHTITDGFTEIFVDTLGKKIAEIDIQFATDKNYKKDVLSSYHFYELNRKIQERKRVIPEFLIANTLIYKTSSDGMAMGNCGNYVFFPSEKWQFI